MTPASPMLGLALGFHPTLPAAVLGALTGVTYGLLAVGLVLIYRTSKVVNFAQGQMGIFGVAVMGLLAHNYHFPYYLALLPALAAGGVAGGVTELVVVRRLRQAPRVMTIVATLGVGALLSTIATAIYPGVQNASFLPSPTWMPTLQLGALQINQAYMAMLVFGPVAVLALTVFLRHSRYGVGNPLLVGESRGGSDGWHIHQQHVQFGLDTGGRTLGPHRRAGHPGVRFRLVHVIRPLAAAAGAGRRSTGPDVQPSHRLRCRSGHRRCRRDAAGKLSVFAGLRGRDVVRDHRGCTASPARDSADERRTRVVGRL